MLIEAGLNDYQDFSPIPVGEYTFAVKDPIGTELNKDDKTDIGGKMYVFKIQSTIQGGEQDGKKLTIRLSNRSKASRYFLRSAVEKLGVPISGTGGFDGSSILGRRFKANVVERKYTVDGVEKTTSDLNSESIQAL